MAGQVSAKLDWEGNRVHSGTHFSQHEFSKIVIVANLPKLAKSLLKSARKQPPKPGGFDRASLSTIICCIGMPSRLPSLPELLLRQPSSAAAQSALHRHSPAGARASLGALALTRGCCLVPHVGA